MADSPAGWTRPRANQDERIAALNPACNAVFEALHKKRLSDQHRTDWLKSSSHSRRRPVMPRSVDTRRIYEDSAPPISSAMRPPARAFLNELIGIVRNGVKRSGGRFEVAEKVA